jgi:hypothetical protein
MLKTQILHFDRMIMAWHRPQATFFDCWSNVKDITMRINDPDLNAGDPGPRGHAVC